MLHHSSGAGHTAQTISEPNRSARVALTGGRKPPAHGLASNQLYRVRRNYAARITKTAMATYWQATPTIVREWKSSWYPNTAGAGSGRRRA
jgi:hypothetical protein